jgi:Uma2 family endonuclease
MIHREQWKQDVMVKIIERSETLADLIDLLGGVPPRRILLRPTPGTATERDVERQLDGRRKRLCELVSGVLLEKDMATREARIGGIIFQRLQNYLDENDLGIAIPADGPLRIFPGLVYIPDVSFIGDEQLPDGDLPDDPVASVYPDLAVEVKSRGNTAREIERKIRDYFRAGTKLVWIIDPAKQVADVYASPSRRKRLAKEGVLDGGDLLPGFKLPLRSLFAKRKPRQAP